MDTGSDAEKWAFPSPSLTRSGAQDRMTARMAAAEYLHSNWAGVIAMRESGFETKLTSVDAASDVMVLWPLA